jgi:hypothetical protein
MPTETGGPSLPETCRGAAAGTDVLLLVLASPVREEIAKLVDAGLVVETTNALNVGNSSRREFVELFNLEHRVGCDDC